MGRQVHLMVLTNLLSTLALVSLLASHGVAQGGRSNGDALAPDLFATVSEGGSRQVMHIGPGTAPGSILVLTRDDAQEFDAAGKRLRISPFPNELWLPVPAKFSTNGPQRIVGLKSGFFSSWIDVLDDAAKRLLKLQASQYSTLEVADVLGDTSKEVLVRYDDGVAVLEPGGGRLGFVRSLRYLDQFRTIQVPGSSRRAIAMWLWLGNGRGVDIKVFSGDGTAVAGWHEDVSERLNVFSLGGPEGEGLWSAPPGRFIERTIQGAVRRSYNVPDMMRFRYLYGGAIAGDRKVIVGSMGTVRSLVCVFDADGTLVGRDILPSPAWAFYVPDPNATVFFVGNGENVLRYDAASLTLPPAARLDRLGPP
jgi:hypothetical protein